MNNVILTSSFSTVAKELYEKGILPNAPQHVALIPTASTCYADHPWLDCDRKSLMGLGYHVHDVELHGKTAKEITAQIESANILFVAGGNTTYLADQAHRSGFHSVVKEFLANGNIYIGSSAGSILAGPTVEPFIAEDLPELPKDFQLQDPLCLTLVNYIILPHHPRYEEYDNKATEKFGSRYPFVRLSDQEYRVKHA